MTLSMPAPDWLRELDCRLRRHGCGDGAIR
jgi:hypothetical protein